MLELVHGNVMTRVSFVRVFIVVGTQTSDLRIQNDLLVTSDTIDTGKSST